MSLFNTKKVSSRKFHDIEKDGPLPPTRLSMNISWSPVVKKALEEYCQSYGLPNAQDACRIFVAAGLKREGFLK